MPIFVGTSDALYLITLVRITAFARPCAMWWNAPSLCAIEWFTPRNAFAKAIPARHEASAIFSLAIGSALPFSNAEGR